MRQHLAKVYACLGGTTAFAVGGAYLHMANIYQSENFFSGLLSVALILGLYLWRDNGKNFLPRLGLLMAIGVTTGESNAHHHIPEREISPRLLSFAGNSLGPLLNMAAALDPTIIVSALIGTSVVFVSFTAAALVAKRGQYIFLGGILMSVINYMALSALANMFIRSTVIYQGQLYIGLVAMSAFILYDTQAIMEKFRLGQRDPITHSMDLFFDLVSVFRRLVIILSQREERNQRKKRN